MRAVLTGLMAVALVLAGGQGVFAQEPPKNLDKFHDRLELMTMWKLMEALDLDKPTADKVYEIRRKFLGQKQELIKEIGAEIGSLRQQLDDRSGNVTDEKLAQAIRTIRGKRKQLDSLMDEQFAELSKVLTVRQQAKLVVFIKDFRKEIRSMIRRPGPGGPGPHPAEKGFGPPPRPDSLRPRAPGTGPDHPLGGRTPPPGFPRHSQVGLPEGYFFTDEML